MKRYLMAFLLCVGIVAVAWAGGAPEDSGQGVAVDENGIALHGADPVAYWSLEPEEESIAGSPEYSHVWRGATWLFVSARNRDLFAEDPERYAPAFGSYCAYGVSEARLLDNDPDAWTIHEDVLYLNVNTRTRDRFQDDIEQRIRQAQQNWPGLRPDR